MPMAILKSISYAQGAVFCMSYQKNMKKITSSSIRTMALTLAMFMLLTVIAFAGDPIPGVDVGVGKNPGGSITIRNGTTDTKGIFTFSTLEAGSYQITVSAGEVQKAIATANRLHPRKDGKPNSVVITIQPSATITVNGQRIMSTAIPLSSSKNNVIIVDLGNAGSISGTITTADTTNK
jgi:hypothetical protein